MNDSSASAENNPPPSTTATKKTTSKGKKPSKVETKSANVSKSASPSVIGNGRSLSLITLSLLLIVAAGLAAGGWWLWQQLEQTRQQLATQSSQSTSVQQQLQQTVSSLNQTVMGVDKDVRGKLEQQNLALQKSLQQAREDMRSAQGPDWLLAETAYLIRLANHRLQLQQDSVTALTALQMADERLRHHDSLAVVEVRRRLADDIAQLKALPMVDIEGLALTLASLQRRVEHLPMAAPLLKSVSGDETQAVTEAQPAWRQFLADLWRTLSSLVTIRHLDENNEAIAAPEQRAFLKQNLALKLEAARYAVLRRDDSAFHDNLAVVRDWLRRYFDREAQAVVAMQSSLAELDQVKLDQAMPVLNASLSAIKALQQQLSTAQPSVAPKAITPETIAPEAITAEPSAP